MKVSMTMIIMSAALCIVDVWRAGEWQFDCMMGWGRLSLPQDDDKVPFGAILFSQFTPMLSPSSFLPNVLKCSRYRWMCMKVRLLEVN